MVTGSERGAGSIEKPASVDRMIEISKTLSADFNFVRVDLYDVYGKVYFGELTFTPETGVIHGCPDEFDVEKGKLLNVNA